MIFQSEKRLSNSFVIFLRGQIFHQNQIERKREPLIMNPSSDNVTPHFYLARTLRNRIWSVYESIGIVSN